MSGAEPLGVLRERDDPAREGEHADRPEQQRSVMLVSHQPH
jgi:hypothetical protein